MPWVKIDDQMPEHPKIAQVGPLAMAMQVAGLCYSNRKLTDGFIPRSIARTLLDWQLVDSAGRLITLAYTSGMAGEDVTSEWVIELLIDAGIWDEVSGGYQIHDFGDYQPSKAEVEAERAAARNRMSSLRANRKRSSDDVRANTEGSSGTPVPVPVPKAAAADEFDFFHRSRAAAEVNRRKDQGVVVRSARGLAAKIADDADFIGESQRIWSHRECDTCKGSGFETGYSPGTGGWKRECKA